MYELVKSAAAALHLDILGGFHPDESDEDLKGFGTVLLFGPKEPGFWDAFTAQKEYKEQRDHPMDQWSVRVISSLATALGGQPFYPFSGPPYHPFYQWALRTGRCHVSPINLLVHDKAGLFVSFRGALALRQRLDLPEPRPSPCVDCARPCASSCPVDAFGSGLYDVDGCRAFLRTEDGQDCLSHGCKARRSCPVSQGYGRNSEQSAYHMRVFLENGP